MSGGASSSTAAPLDLGVEEEFHLVDLETRRLVPAADRVLAALAEERVVPELQASMVESNSNVWTSLDELRTDLADLRRRLCSAAASLGIGVVAAGSVPLTSIEELVVAPGDRNAEMTDEYAIIAREQVICGVQTQVGITDRDLAARILSRSLPWAPVFLALSASSPYWMGADTGYASYRTQIWGRWPTAGVPHAFVSASDYDDLVNELVATQTILDRGMIYFDGRLSVRFPTIEYRVCDACPTLDDGILLAGLWRALAWTCAAEIESGPEPLARHETVQAAKWRAARSGLSGRLLDPVDRRPVPAADAVASLLRHLRPGLEALGDWEQVSSLAADLLGRGCSADRQRAAFDRRGSLDDVVDWLVEQTAQV